MGPETTYVPEPTSSRGKYSKRYHYTLVDLNGETHNIIVFAWSIEDADHLVMAVCREATLLGAYHQQRTINVDGIDCTEVRS